MDIIGHSEQCATATIRTKCKQCITNYTKERVRIHRLKKAQQIQHTRSVTNKIGSKYKNDRCITCKDKSVIKELCSDCKIKYNRARGREYRLREKARKDQINSFESSIALNSVCQVKTKCEMTINISKSKCKVTKLSNNVPELTNQVQPSNVLKSMCQVKSKKDNVHCAQSNHITYPSISERPITAHKIQNLSKEKY